MSESVLLSRSVDDTVAIGRLIGAQLMGGEVVALTGELGAGKTHLAKGLAGGLGFSQPDEVNSPTFVLINEYKARLKIHHIDAYRLNDAGQLLSLGFEEMCSTAAVVILEWADRVAAIVPGDALWISMRARGDSERTLALRTADAGLKSRLGSAGLDQWLVADDKNPS
jgi:tRNA threonylcarbamoyladenosine biosynthesis protein TsaE